jgi:hypothetical protein
LYLPDETVSIRARVTGSISFGKLQAEITSVSHEQLAVTFDFVERERDLLLIIDGLQPGLYRVRVQTENLSDQSPTPVHDLFEVVRRGR